MKDHVTALFKYPSFVLSLSGACGVFIGFGSAWATQVSRIDSLERSFNSAKESFVTKDQLETIRQMIRGLDEKVEVKFEGLEKLLKR